jgi:hypothetical protein
MLEGARADAIQYARVAERLASVVERSNAHIARVASDGRVPEPVTAGRLAIQQLEALKASGSAGYYGKRDVTPNGDHGRAPWAPNEAARGPDAYVATPVEIAMGSGKPDPALVEKWGKVSTAIAQRAGGDRGLWRHLRSVADELLAAGVDHDDVAKRILAGDTVDV